MSINLHNMDKYFKFLQVVVIFFVFNQLINFRVSPLQSLAAG